MANEDLWNNYWASGSIEDRNRLLEKYMGLVKYVIRKCCYSSPDVFEESDLLNSGVIGLCESVERYDPSRGIKFETYSIPRIKGSIIDELRKNGSPISRQSYERWKEIKKTADKLEKMNLCEASDAEIAENIGIDEKTLRKWQRDFSFSKQMSLDILHTGDGKDYYLHEIIPDEIPNPLEALEIEERDDILAESVKSLPYKQRVAVELYYFNGGMTMKDIGKLIGVSESRVSQIHDEAAKKLKDLILD